MMELLSELAGIKRGLAGRGWVGREMLLRLLIGGAGLALALLMAILWIAERRSPSAAVEGATVIAWDRDGRRMLRGDRGGEIWGWEIEGEQALHGRCGETPIIALVAAPAGVVVAAAQGGEVCLWRQAGETLEVRRLPVLARSGTSLAIDPEGRWLVLGDAGGEVRAIELDGGRPLGQWSAGSSIVGARVTREGEIVAVTREGIHRFRLRAGQGGDENIL